MKAFSFCAFSLLMRRGWCCEKNILIPVKKENTEPLRVAAYCRVSTKKETQLASLAHQIMAYTEQISDHPGWVFSGVFWDCGRSGLRKKGRNGLKHMLESAAEGKIDYIITKSAKRVSRNTVELLQIMRYLKERLNRARLLRTADGNQISSGNRYSSKY